MMKSGFCMIIGNVAFIELTNLLATQLYQNQILTPKIFSWLFSDPLIQLATWSDYHGKVQLVFGTAVSKVASILATSSE